MALETLNTSQDNPKLTADVTGQEAAAASGQPRLSADTTGGAYVQVNPKNKILDPKQTNELLQRMEQMLEQKTGPWAQFMGGIQDALAYTVPQMGGQQALALQQRAQQRNQEMQDVFNMRQQMATVKSQSEMAQAQNAAADALLGGGDVVGGAGGAGGALSIPPEVRAMIAANPAMRSQILNDYLKTASTKRLDAQGNIQGSYKIPGVEDLVNMTPNEYLTFQATGKLPAGVGGAQPSGGGLKTVAAGAPQLTGGYKGVAADVNNPTGMRSNGGFDTFDTPQAGVAADMQKSMRYLSGEGPMKGIAPTPENVVGMWVAGDPKQGATIQDGRYVGRVLKELKDAGVKLNPDGTIPAIPEAAAAVSRAKIIHEAGKNADKFLQYATPEILNQKPLQVAGPIPTTTAGIAPTSKENLEAIRKLKVASGESQIAVTEAQQKEVAKQEGEKRAEYIKSLSTADSTFNDLDKLLNASKGQKQVFNLSGSGVKGPAQSLAVKAMGLGEKTDENANDAIARTFLKGPDQTAYNQVKTGAAVAQANFGKNLVEGAGGKLTNADLTLGKIAKGMGVEQTYDSHMFNLAKSMEAARTIYYRSQAFEKWQAEHPNEPISKFETSKEYKTDAKVQAAIDVAKRVADVPELAGKFVHKDANGRQYVTVNGKSYYIGGAQ